MKQHRELAGKRILLGVSGSIAAYKAVEVLRRLQNEGASVSIAMTKNAERFIGPLTFAALTGKPVVTDDFAVTQQHVIRHVDLTEGIDLALVAPATANIIGKIAGGIADDALSTSLMACTCPLIIAPAMNDRMYRNPFFQRNIKTLKTLGVTVVEPESGWLACGAVGPGRLADTEAIIDAVCASLGSSELTGNTILVTAGPTREPIDAVRFISNPSTGKMGYALADAARRRGAKVILVSGPSALEAPGGVELVPVVTAAEMKRAVLDRVNGCEVVIMAAAVSDFRPAHYTDGKIKKDSASTSLLLEQTDDILKELAATEGTRLLVGFAAETDDLIPNAVYKLKTKNLDMIIANNLNVHGAGFGTDTNAVTIIERDGGITELPVMPKPKIAELIIEKVAQLIAKQRILP